LTKRKDRRSRTGDAGAMFDTAPILTPTEALLTGAGIIFGGTALFVAMLLITRWLAKR
jgi:hypothetical protein